MKTYRALINSDSFSYVEWHDDQTNQGGTLNGLNEDDLTQVVALFKSQGFQKMLMMSH